MGVLGYPTRKPPHHRTTAFVRLRRGHALNTATAPDPHLCSACRRHNGGAWTSASTSSRDRGTGQITWQACRRFRLSCAARLFLVITCHKTGTGRPAVPNCALCGSPPRNRRHAARNPVP